MATTWPGVGVVSLTGFGSDWIISGSASDVTLYDEGVGQISEANQARPIVSDDTFIGAQSTSSGKLIVADLGSLYDGGDLVIAGDAGVGIVEVFSGGTVESDEFIVGNLSNGQGTGTINGNLSRCTASTVTAGDAGRDRWATQFHRGGRARRHDLRCRRHRGCWPGHPVEQHGVELRREQLRDPGAGSLVVRDGGRATSSSAISLANATTAVDSITVDGAGSRLTVSGAMTLSSGEGYVTISNGGVVTTSNVTISGTGRVSLLGGRLEATAASSTAVAVSSLALSSKKRNGSEWHQLSA